MNGPYLKMENALSPGLSSHLTLERMEKVRKLSEALSIVAFSCAINWVIFLIVAIIVYAASPVNAHTINIGGKVGDYWGSCSVNGATASLIIALVTTGTRWAKYTLWALLASFSLVGVLLLLGLTASGL